MDPIGGLEDGGAGGSGRCVKTIFRDSFFFFFVLSEDEDGAGFVTGEVARKSMGLHLSAWRDRRNEEQEVTI